MKRRLALVIGLLSLAGIVALMIVALQTVLEPTLYRITPVGIMGTECSLQAVARVGQDKRAKRALEAAEAELRKVESLMSVKLEFTEIARFNAAPAGELVPLSPASLEVLTAARQAATDTGGAFDVTARPLFELWKQAGKEGRLPTRKQLAQARAASSWEHITLKPNGAVKSVATACVDLGGLAKGYAVDQAAEAMKRTGVRGGIAQAGGDTRCFGTRPPDGEPWRIAVRDPFHPRSEQSFAVLRLSDGAVCTSGNYFRFVEIQGNRFSHIIDPRPGPHVGTPADAAPSVTVVAPQAITADIWATALSVLGPEGLTLLPRGVEAMIVEGSAEDYRLHMTGGFAKLLEQQPRIAP